MQEKQWLFGNFCHSGYRNDPKFSNRYAWANSADPDQTAPSLHRLDSLLYGRAISSNLEWLQQIFWVSEYLGNLW